MIINGEYISVFKYEMVILLFLLFAFISEGVLRLIEYLFKKYKDEKGDWFYNGYVFLRPIVRVYRSMFYILYTLSCIIPFIVKQFVDMDPSLLMIISAFIAAGASSMEIFNCDMPFRRKRKKRKEERKRSPEPTENFEGRTDT